MHKLFFSLMGLCIIVLPVFSQSDIIDISFEGIPEFINTHSPIVKMIDQAYNLKKAERKSNLTWSNPLVDYSQEVIQDNILNEKEHFLVLSKQFEMPWIYTSRRKSWHFLMESAAYQKKEQLNNFIGDIKGGYVEIKLLEEQINRLEIFKHLLADVAKIAQHQAEEGAISEIDQQLIQMTLFNINSDLVQLVQKKYSIENQWKSKIGVDETNNLLLTTKIDFKSIKTESPGFYLASIPTTLGILHRENLKNALQKQIQVAKRSWLPYVNLAGGYKKVEPNFEGYTFGLSLPIPILNTNRAQVNKFQIELELFDNELLLYRLELNSQIKTKLNMINTYLMALQKNSSQFKSIEDVMENIVFSYQQGSLSLIDVLNSTQIYTEGIQNYYEQLIAYYRSIFEFEAVIGKTLIVF